MLPTSETCRTKIYQTDRYIQITFYGSSIFIQNKYITLVNCSKFVLVTYIDLRGRAAIQNSTQ